MFVRDEPEKITQPQYPKKIPLKERVATYVCTAISFAAYGLAIFLSL